MSPTVAWPDPIKAASLDETATLPTGDTTSAISTVVCETALIDGEMVVQDENGLADFDALRDAVASIASKTGPVLLDCPATMEAVYMAIQRTRLTGNLTKVTTPTTAPMCAPVRRRHW